MAARFILKSPKNPELLNRAKSVYLVGLNKFPESHTVLQAYLLTYNIYIALDFIDMSISYSLSLEIGVWDVSSSFLFCFNSFIDSSKMQHWKSFNNSNPPSTFNSSFTDMKKIRSSGRRVEITRDSWILWNSRNYSKRLADIIPHV